MTVVAVAKSPPEGFHGHRWTLPGDPEEASQARHTVRAHRWQQRLDACPYTPWRAEPTRPGTGRTDRHRTGPPPANLATALVQTRIARAGRLRHGTHAAARVYAAQRT
ncbi:hypothetical protein [Kitasatospora sp. NPDC092286]|uniref:hypothetical protein n=1 Tax=Kitasatospora sp. NPDC092286 TaxID=3364087 RepID=UPI003825B550